MATTRITSRDNRPAIALTGATGFIGHYILSSLLENDYRVTALVRDPARLAARHREHEALNIVTGDISKKISISELCRNVAGIIHCAGLIRAASNAEFFETNAAATEQLVAIAGNSNVCWFLLISSLAAREPGISAYATSKFQGETALKCASTKLDWAIVRPPCVYGPGDRETSRLIRGARMGRLPTVADRTARFSLLHAVDLAAGITDLIGNGQLERQIIEPDDGKPGGYSWDEIAAILSDVMLRPVRPLHLPYLPVWAIISAYSALSSAAGIAPIVSPAKLREISHPDWVSKVRRDHAAFSRYWGRNLHGAIEDMVNWMNTPSGQGKKHHKTHEFQLPE